MKMWFIAILLEILNLCFYVRGILETKDLSVVILSQENNYDLKVATDLKDHICDQADALNQECPLVFLSHEKFPHVGQWTILPILPKVAEYTKNSSWILFVEDRTVIRLKFLLEALNEYDEKKNIWIGHGLKDETPTIIHHFRDKHFHYPHFGAGIAISNALLQSSAKQIPKISNSADFNIDKSYELALFIWNNGNGTMLTHNKLFCSVYEAACISYPRPFETCETILSTSSIYFAVKTCTKFHENRVPIVLKTWARYARKIGFFSDVTDNAIPTINLGIPNTESGHCGKTIKILKFFNQELENDPDLHWIIVVDDDTILSISRMLELLSCYNSDDEVALGERYGYNVHNSVGFNYITGGGGMVFSRALIKKLAGVCKCPSISSPDDMVLGQCMAALGVEVTHSHLFHQARPVDYSPDFLKSDRHVSFHKHWMIDPEEVYNDWFAEKDSELIKHINDKTEL